MIDVAGISPKYSVLSLDRTIGATPADRAILALWEALQHLPMLAIVATSPDDDPRYAPLFVGMWMRTYRGMSGTEVVMGVLADGEGRQELRPSEIATLAVYAPDPERFDGAQWHH